MARRRRRSMGVRGQFVRWPARASFSLVVLDRSVSFGNNKRRTPRTTCTRQLLLLTTRRAAVDYYVNSPSAILPRKTKKNDNRPDFRSVGFRVPPIGFVLEFSRISVSRSGTKRLRARSSKTGSPAGNVGLQYKIRTIRICACQVGCIRGRIPGRGHRRSPACDGFRNVNLLTR